MHGDDGGDGGSGSSDSGAVANRNGSSVNSGNMANGNGGICVPLSSSGSGSSDGGGVLETVSLEMCVREVHLTVNSSGTVIRYLQFVYTWLLIYIGEGGTDDFESNFMHQL